MGNPGGFRGIDLCLTADYSGNILASGTFYEIINIGNTSLTSAGSSDVFVSKYNQNGEFQWAIRAGGEDVEYSGLISSNGQNNTYLTGEFLSVDVTVKDFSITLNEGDGNVLCAKIDQAGNPVWINSKAGSLVEWGDYYGWPTSIKTDATGNFYIKGWHADSVYRLKKLLRDYCLQCLNKPRTFTLPIIKFKQDLVMSFF